MLATSPPLATNSSVVPRTHYDAVHAFHLEKCPGIQRLRSCRIIAHAESLLMQNHCSCRIILFLWNFVFFRIIFFQWGVVRLNYKLSNCCGTMASSIVRYYLYIYGKMKRVVVKPSPLPVSIEALL